MQPQHFPQQQQLLRLPQLQVQVQEQIQLLAQVLVLLEIMVRFLLLLHDYLHYSREVEQGDDVDDHCHVNHDCRHYEVNNNNRRYYILHY